VIVAGRVLKRQRTSSGAARHPGMTAITLTVNLATGVMPRIQHLVETVSV